jgi:hypothetical protein
MAPSSKHCIHQSVGGDDVQQPPTVPEHRKIPAVPVLASVNSNVENCLLAAVADQHSLAIFAAKLAVSD